MHSATNPLIMVIYSNSFLYIAIFCIILITILHFICFDQATFLVENAKSEPVVCLLVLFQYSFVLQYKYNTKNKKQPKTDNKKIARAHTHAPSAPINNHNNKIINKKIYPRNNAKTSSNYFVFSHKFNIVHKFYKKGNSHFLFYFSEPNKINIPLLFFDILTKKRK